MNIPLVTSADEVIVYRTRADILTNQRLILQGMTFPLRQVTTVNVARVWYYVPLQILRLLALLTALLFLAYIWNELSVGLIGFLLLMIPLILSIFAFALPWFVPPRVLQVETNTGKFNTVRSNDIEFLKEFREEILQTMNKIRSAEHL